MELHSISTLHTLNKTTQYTSLNDKLTEVIEQNDSVILIEDGVYQARQLLTAAEHQQKSWHKIAKHVYALEDDAIARGIPPSIEGITFVSYEEFVKLSLSHKKVVSWY